MNSGYSYNRPNLSSNSTWSTYGLTIANQTLIGSNPFDLFINQNNTNYILNQQILIFPQGNLSSIQNISVHLINSSSLFVTKDEEIYVDTFYSSMASVISEITRNSTDLIPISRFNLCKQCFDVFISENQILYCSLSEQHFETLEESSLMKPIQLCLFQIV